MKKVLIIIGLVFAVLLAAAFILPIVFKDDIKAAIDKELAKSVNADVVFDADKFSLSLFSNFPNITAEMKDFGVINREPFAGEVLFAAERFEAEVNLKDLLFGDQMRLKGLTLVRPLINVKVLADGRANYDIAIPSTDTTTTTTEESGDFSFGIDHWEIIEGDIVYDDKSIPFLMEMKNMNHSGSGDFTQSVFDLKTKTTVDTLNVGYDGDMYLANKHADIDMTISIAEEYTKYTFKENSAKLNDFAMSFDGWFKMNEKDYGMDISFKSPENTFKSLLSLVPGMYSESFKNIETSGDLAFNGFVKGTYSDTQMPAFNVDLKVNNAMFKYPDLAPINNINMDMLVDNKDGVIDNTVIDIKKFHMDFGSNPVDARALISKMYPTVVDANIMAKLNLAELSKMFPVEGLDMKGNFALNLTAKGVYDSLKKTIPSIDAAMSLANGYVKSAEFPLPLQDLKFNSSIKNSSGKMAETFIAVKDFSMNMDGEKFNADLLIQNLNDYTWDLKAKGGVDLEKMTKIFPLEGMTLAGKVKADLETKGKMSDLDAERYDKLPTSGSASLSAFKYTSKDLPYDVTMSKAEMAFDPRKIDLKQVAGTIGKSDFSVNGSVNNYIGYIFGKGELLKGTMNFNSNYLDLNEFMTETEETTTTTTDTASYGVIPVPENIDFLLKSDIKTVKVMDLTLTNASGDIIVKDATANLNGLKFNMLGGSFNVSGTYNTKDVKHPKYDLALGIQNLSIQQSAATFSMVRSFAPIAGLVNGNFSTDFKMSGELLETMMPNLKTVNGAGLVKIAQATLKDSKLVSGITSVTKLDNTSEVSMKDVLMSTKIKDGRLSVEPFDVKFGSYKTTVAGSSGIDGSLDYKLKMDVPAGKLGSQFNSFVSSNTGGSSDPNKPIPVTIGLGGNYLNPSPKLMMAEQKQQAKDAATTAAKQEATKQGEKLVTGLLGGKTKTDTTKAKTDSTKTVKTEDKVKQEATQTIQNLLKRKKK